MEAKGIKHQHQIDHVFRHHYGQLVASLAKRVGIEHLALVEDAVQEAMAAALVSWPIKGKPQEEVAWLYQVAYRKLMSGFRSDKRKQSLLIQQALIITDEQASLQEGDLQVPLSKEMADDLLALLFITCDPAINMPSQLVFTLKSLCGFSIIEISQRLFISKANVYKRFERAKQALKTANLDSAKLSNTAISNFAVVCPDTLACNAWALRLNSP